MQERRTDSLKLLSYTLKVWQLVCCQLYGLLEGGESLPLLQGIPGGDLLGQTRDFLGVVFRHIGLLVRILQEVEELWPLFRSRVGGPVSIHLAVVGQYEFPRTFDTPAIEQRGFWILDVGNVMGEALPEYRAACDSRTVREIWQEVETG